MSDDQEGATGVDPAPVNSKMPTSQGLVSKAKNSVNGHRHSIMTNGHPETHGTASSTQETKCSVDHFTRHLPHNKPVNGFHNHTQVFKVPETRLITKKLFYSLLSASGLGGEVVEVFKVPEYVVRKQPKSQLICRAVDLTTEYIKSPDNALEAFIEDLEKMKLDAQESTMYSEFLEVAKDLFCDRTNFGRVISFLRFSVAYAVHVYRKGNTQAVSSIEAWTVKVLEEDLGSFFKQNKGWEGYVEYMETLLRAERRARRPPPSQETRSVWDTMYAFGAVAAGVAAAYGLKQVFS